MMYDEVQTYSHDTNFSCAYGTFMADMTLFDKPDRWQKIGLTRREMEDRMWRTLCRLLSASERRSVLFATTDKELSWIEMLEACPYVEQIDSQQSQHGRYRVQLWIARKHERNAV